MCAVSKKFAHFITFPSRVWRHFSLMAALSCLFTLSDRVCFLHFEVPGLVGSCGVSEATWKHCACSRDRRRIPGAIVVHPVYNIRTCTRFLSIPILYILHKHLSPFTFHSRIHADHVSRRCIYGIATRHTQMFGNDAVVIRSREQAVRGIFIEWTRLAVRS